MLSTLQSSPSLIENIERGRRGSCNQVSVVWILNTNLQTIIIHTTINLIVENLVDVEGRVVQLIPWCTDDKIRVCIIPLLICQIEGCNYLVFKVGYAHFP